MANGKNTAAFIILSILALGGLGLSGYMFINNQFLGGSEHTHDNNKLIAVWDKITGSGSNFDMNISQNLLNQSDYFILTDGTNLTLTHEGWYRISITITLTGLDITGTYVIKVEKNGFNEVSFGYVRFPQEEYLCINAAIYVYSDGNDYFHFNCYNSAPDDFSIATNQDYNQMALEFVE